MAEKKKKNGMTREEALELYSDLQKAMATMLKNNPEGAPPPRAAAQKGKTVPPKAQLKAPTQGPKVRQETTASSRGPRAAIAFVALFAISRIVIAGLEAGGIGTVENVEASMGTRPITAPANRPREEMELLTALDSKRAELEERSRRLEERENDLKLRDREFAVRLTQLRDLTGKLRGDREQTEKKRNGQLEQLANVYGSMNPNEAASLLEQLDITTALALVEKMPEKRIGQILALMTKDRALTLTKMLTGREG